MNTKIRKLCNSFPIQLFVTGEGIEQHCQQYCNVVGLCVTVTETNYIYSGGSEKGYIIGLINYPRFPKEEFSLFRLAEDLGFFLLKNCNPSGSFTLQDPSFTYFYSNREGD